MKIQMMDNSERRVDNGGVLELEMMTCLAAVPLR